MTSREREMLDALLEEADLTAGAMLLDWLLEIRDPRAGMLSHGLGMLHYELQEIYEQADEAGKTKDDNAWVGARWSEAAECSRAWGEFRRVIAGLFWAEMVDAQNIEDTTRRLQAALEFATHGEGEPTK